MTKKKAGSSDKYILNCIPSKDISSDWQLDAASGAGLMAASYPSAKDLRDDSWWPIGDQGLTGSCVGWATADSVLRWHFVKADKLQLQELLSPRYVWMAAKETDEFTTRPSSFIELEGTSLKAALDIARKFGVVTDTMLPFNSGKLYPDKANVFYAIAAQRKISSYFSLGINPSDWRNWLANNGPILTRLNVDATWIKAASTDGTLATYRAETARGGHAIALVGYTQEHFIVRNSWGQSWGDKGFAYASDSYAKAAFTEAYGVAL